MTIKEVKALKQGDKVANKDGKIYEVERVCPYWNGALISKELEQARPDGWYVVVKHSTYLMFNRKQLSVVKD